jgi:UDP-2,3-diacylglucosamine pyrophosphatase LpxH
MKKRDVDVLIVSDIHLGTYGCHAEELLTYFKSIKPKKVVLNGDIIDIWQFRKRYWPTSHMKVIKYVMGWIAKGVDVDYIPGNHDEMLRKFVGFELGNFRIENKLLLNVEGKKAWIFHGDVFDVTMQHSKWLAQLGAIGYDLLIYINTFVNFFSKLMGKGPISLSKRIKDKVKSAVKFVNDFENTAAGIAVSKNYDYVICGHIHKPQIKVVENKNGLVTYLNSGDWVENLTALEYHKGEWDLFRFSETERIAMLKNAEEEAEGDVEEMDDKQLFSQMVSEFNLKKS